MKNLSRWQRGLLSGSIRGFATALESGLALVVVAPEKFSVNGGLWTTVGAVILLALFRAMQVCVAYLKDNPLPPAKVKVKFPHSCKRPLAV